MNTLKNIKRENRNLFNSKLYFSIYHYPKNQNDSKTVNNDIYINIDEIYIKNYLSKDLLEMIGYSSEEKKRNNNSNLKEEKNQEKNIMKNTILKINSFSNDNKKINDTSFVQNKKIKYNKKNKKNFVEREGDWTCFYCGNLNFSFRKICNRCFSLRINSEIEHDKYMENVLYIINENQKKRILLNE